MRKNLGAKEWLYPMPVLIIGSYDADGNPDAMNAAWGGIGDTKQIFLCLSPEHKTVKNILLKKASVHKQIGNAVPCLLAKSMCNYLKSVI